MSNNPILPIVPNGAAPLNDNTADDERELPVNDPNLDDGETADSQATVDHDLDEGTSVNEKLSE